MSFITLFHKLNKVQVSLKLKRKTRYLKNVFDTQHPKKVLISYLSSSFTRGASEKHTSLLECITAGKVFNGLGYNVDVIDFDDDDKNINFAQYEIVYGFGTPYEKSFADKNFKGKRILYSTGCNSNFTNITTTKRLKEFHEKTGILDPELIRTVDNSWPLQKYLSDAILSLGNQFVANTYRSEGITSSIFELDLFYPKSDSEKDMLFEDYSTIKNNLIWFGSKSSVHKGLDITLEIIKQIPDLKLFICGYQKNYEIELYNYYKDVFESNQVVDCGFVNIHSTQFADIVNNCGAAIFPTAAEGGAAALLTLMGNAGIIPITTKNAGLDIEQYGFVAQNVTYSDIEIQVLKYLNTPEKELEINRKLLKNYIQSKHNYELYYKSLKSAIEKTLIPT